MDQEAGDAGGPSVQPLGQAAAAPAAVAPVDAEPAGGRQPRASAAKAAALMTGWHEEEEAPFTAVAGNDIFVTKENRATGEQRRERARQRGGGGLAARPRRAAMGQLRVEEEWEYGSDDDSEEDAGAKDEDSDGGGFSVPRRRGGAAAAPRRRSAAPAGSARPRRLGARPAPEVVASERPKRQRHSRAEDPDMLDTDMALSGAFEEGGLPASAPRTRSRAPPPPAAPPAPPPEVAAAEAEQADVFAAAVAAAATPSAVAMLPPMLPVAAGSVGLTAPQPTIPGRRGGGQSAAAIRAARAPSPGMQAGAAATPSAADAGDQQVAAASAGEAPATAADAAAPQVAAPEAAAAAVSAPAASTEADAGSASQGAAAPMVAFPLIATTTSPAAAAALAAAQGQFGLLDPAMLLPASLQAAAAFQAAVVTAAVQAAATMLKAPSPTPAAAAAVASGEPAAAPASATQPAAAGAPGAAAVSELKAEPYAAAPAEPATKAEAAEAPASSQPPSAAANGFSVGGISTRGTRPAERAAPRSVGSVDVLYGCAKCRYLRGGCNSCRAREPAFTRPCMRWKPAEGHHQTGISAVPAFRPTAEEFADPIAYLEKIKPEAEKYGLAHIVPPPGWDPPFALERGTNGLSMESFRFAVRKQYTSHLCRRAAPPVAAPGTPTTGASGRYGGRVNNSPRGGGDKEQEQAQAQMQAHGGCEAGPAPMHVDGVAEPAAAADPPAGSIGDAPEAADARPREGEQQREQPKSGAPPPSLPQEFGFPHLERKHTLRSFSAYADWVKEVHFSDPLPPQPLSRGASARGARSSQRRPRSLPCYSTLPEPSVEQIEAEFWRIVESPEGAVESLYGQDVDSGHHGSGFPLPLWRRRLLEQHLARAAAAGGGGGGAPVELPNYANEEERRWAEHPWNINNMPRAANSVLRYLPGLDGELITGVMVPWLYVGSCMSAFCWHVEDHALCSINYLHMGAPKVWYGVPASATAALEEAMRDALPHLFASNQRLLYQLVTTLSPLELKKRGVPVYRVVHEPGSFVVTMPDAYHAGFNCGFNVAEAVNFGPSHWIPFGSDIADKYRATGKPLTLSHDSLMVALTQAAASQPPAKQQLQADMAGPLEALNSGSGEQQQDMQQQQQQQAGEAGGRRRRGEEEVEEPLSPLGPAPLHRAPRDGIVLAAGELALRAAEERRRRMVSFVAVGALPERCMHVGAPPASKDAQGVHANTADCDCARCSGDLWLSAVVSPAAPGVAVCPEHADVLVKQYGCPRASLVLLYRHTPQELDALVADAVQRVEGAAAAVAAAKQRRAQAGHTRVHATPVGPMFQMEGPGQPQGALAMPVDGDDCCDSSGGEDSSDEDWEQQKRTSQRRGSGGGSTGRGATKRRRATTKRQRPRTAAAAAAAAEAVPAGRMGGGGKRARLGTSTPAIVPADVAAAFAPTQAVAAAAVETAASPHAADPAAPAPAPAPAPAEPAWATEPAASAEPAATAQAAAAEPAEAPAPAAAQEEAAAPEQDAEAAAAASVAAAEAAALSAAAAADAAAEDAALPAAAEAAVAAEERAPVGVAAVEGPAAIQAEPCQAREQQQQQQPQAPTQLQQEQQQAPTQPQQQAPTQPEGQEATPAVIAAGDTAEPPAAADV